MPTYEYRCPNGHQFERFQKMSEEPRATCPDCGLESERILSGGAGFLFKGDGFYATDYRSDSYKKKAAQESSPGKTGAGKTGAGKATGESGGSGKDEGSSNSSDSPSSSPAGDDSGPEVS